MLSLLGKPAWPSFRLRRAEAELAAIEGRELELVVRSLILIDADRVPEDLERERLEALLSATLRDSEPVDDRRLLILPRPGVRSPWASKAGDILARCGLEAFARLEQGLLISSQPEPARELSEKARARLFDRMTQVVVGEDADLGAWFAEPEPGPLGVIALGDEPARRLARANREMGLALSEGEVDYLVAAYTELGRDPTDAELMMFAQANSEHCRHKIFNASWRLDGADLDDSLFGLIRNTHAANPEGTLVAYDDNAAVIEGFEGSMLLAPADDPVYRLAEGRIHVQIKVETHNHPTAISPDPGAATGSGGEIRDESATGRGGRPVAALTGFSVSDLRIPGFEQPWELTPEPPGRLASACQIMLEGPIGAARYNNEFGRPALLGYFRSFSRRLGDRLWGYHKPIMLAGGSGMITEGQLDKLPLDIGDRIIVLGGPAMLIGLGGGAASSMSSGQSSEDLDYASVQRPNPEMQRRCQEVIDRCWSQGANNPIRSIHDVGAGGLSNAIPELLHDGGVGGELDLRAIPSADPGLSPVEIWCNESQERYVLAVAPSDVERFRAICERERCPWADLGPATGHGRLRLDDPAGSAPVVDLDLETLLGRPPKTHRDAVSVPVAAGQDGLAGIDPSAALDRVLSLPGVGSKQFLITIGDRTVGGLSARDQMVGRHQVPVADCAITLSDYEHHHGSAMAIGERTPLAVHDAAAAARVAIGEVLTNLVGTRVRSRGRIKLSANWMAAAGAPGQDAALRAAVEAASDFCQALDLAIPVGKDSLSMQTLWHDNDEEMRLCAPVSLIVSGFAPVPDVRNHRTPELMSGAAESELLLIDLGQRRLGGSALSQVLDRELGEVPDVEQPAWLAAMFDAVQQLVADGLVLACHDRSDGGLLVTVAEMALAGHCGAVLELPGGVDALSELFNEELGIVLQVERARRSEVIERLEKAGLCDAVRAIGQPGAEPRLVVRGPDRVLIDRPMAQLAQDWSQTSYRMQRLRDHPDCADEEFEAMGDWSRPGLVPQLGFAPEAPTVLKGARPKVAILREQGVNGQREMARAFMAAGFEAVDVHMSDLDSGRADLADYTGLAVCGGFSFGDVLGAGQGWARSILFNPRLHDGFARFFDDSSRFTLGVCNGCQMLATLRSIIPGAEDWPMFGHNRSRQFEARLSLVEVTESPSILLAGMAGSRLPVATAHGEGRALIESGQSLPAGLALRYVDGQGRPAERYPDNPNGSPEGLTGLCNSDGRVTIMMPHPERLLRTLNFSWAPADWPDVSPWMQLFFNARRWVG